MIVAAQGGGSYSAYHTALVLARLQDTGALENKGDFGEHLFAISGVSGGAIGGSIFLAAYRALSGIDANNRMPEITERCAKNKSIKPPTPGQKPYEHLIRCIFRHDLMSPIVGRALFHDIPAYFLPSGLSKKLPAWLQFKEDRADILAKSLGYIASEEWVSLNAGGNQLADAKHFEKFFESSAVYRSDNEMGWPALIVNTTVVETGAPLLIAPMWWDSSSRESARFYRDAAPLFFHRVVPEQDINLNTAVVASSRFPWLLPVASVNVKSSQAKQMGLSVGEGKETVKIRVADGGYFENSGATAAVSLLEYLYEIDDHPGVKRDRELKVHVDNGCGGLQQGKDIKIEFHLLVFTHKNFHTSPGQRLSDYVSPVRTLLNTRVQRGVEAIRYAYRRGDIVMTHPIYLGDSDFLPPLGLMLSNETLQEIENRSGFLNSSIGKKSTASENSEELRRVLDRLLL
jgi:Patatin-like phospholipase